MSAIENPCVRFRPRPLWPELLEREGRERVPGGIVLVNERSLSALRTFDRRVRKRMHTFTIHARNATHQHPTRDVEKFASEKELAKLAAQWPARRLVEFWNGMPGVRRVAPAIHEIGAP